MDIYIGQIEQFLRNNHDWAGFVTFLLTLGESLLIVGLFVPATALLLVIGMMIGSDVLSPWSILVWGIVGAIIGDALSYGIGRWLGPGLQRRWPFTTQRTAVARARLFFSRYGFVAVVAGRFLGPTRSTIPAVAGIMGMKHAHFQFANVLSAITWLPLMLAPGFILARGMKGMYDSANIGLIVSIAVSVLIGAALVVMVIRKHQMPDRRRAERKSQAGR